MCPGIRNSVQEFWRSMAFHLLLFLLLLYLCFYIYNIYVYTHTYISWLYVFGIKARICPYSLQCHFLYIGPYICLLWVTISLIYHGQNFARLQSRTCQLTLAHMRDIKRVVWPMSEQPCSWRQVAAFAQSHMNRSCDQLFDYHIISNSGAQMEWVSPSCSTCSVVFLLLTGVQA